ncbi:cystinosin-like [Penaeus indicus]|uniref:cystinosin-like n=1 Tax=Penaeus indicus TaxID=29960 RepID=UPI00300CA67C
MMRLSKRWFLPAVAFIIAASCEGAAPTEPPASLSLIQKDLEIVRGDSAQLDLTLSGEITSCVNVTFTSEPKQLTEELEAFELCAAENGTSWQIFLNSTTVGKTVVYVHAFPPGLVSTEDAFVRLAVIVDPGLNIFGDVLGWIYTIAWDISFFPQIIHNWRRKSVIGLSFDFLTFNFIGFFSYFIFNMGLLWIDEIQAEYFDRNPTGVLHVRLNDVIFPLYALVCTAIQIVQCFFYEREPQQRVSTTCRIISAVLIVSALIGCVVVPLVDSLLWLDLFYWLSYIKLIITAIKYTPQLWENYQRKSTAGWSIYQVILDFTGGSLSLVQMFLLAGNYNDWLSILTDPAKLGLGLLSIFFNIFFFIQHYCLYKNSEKRKQSAESGHLEKNGELLNGKEASPRSISDVSTHM